MEISFGSEETRDVCEKRTAATKALGDLATAVLLRVLADIDAVANMHELISLFDEGLTAISADEYSISLGREHQMIVRSGNANHPKEPTGNTDWKRVSRLRIIAIGAR